MATGLGVGAGEGLGVGAGEGCLVGGGDISTSRVGASVGSSLVGVLEG